MATHAVVLPEKGPTSTRVLFFNDAIPGPTDSNYTIGHVATIPPMGNPPLPGNWTKVRQDEINFFCSGTNYARGGVISIAGGQLGKYYEGTKTFVVFDPAMMTFKRRGDMEPTFQPDHPMGAGHLLPAADPWRNRP